MTNYVVVLKRNKHSNTEVGYTGSLSNFFLHHHFKNFPEIAIPAEIKSFWQLKKSQASLENLTFNQFLSQWTEARFAPANLDKESSDKENY